MLAYQLVGLPHYHESFQQNKANKTKKNFRKRKEQEKIIVKQSP